MSTAPAVRPAHLRLLGGLFVGALLLVIIFWNFIPHSPPDFRCADLLAISDKDVAISLPPNCVESSEASSDAMVKYLENERKRQAWFSRTGLFASRLARHPSPGLIFNKISTGCQVITRSLTSLGAPSLSFLTGSPHLAKLQSPLKCV